MIISTGLRPAFMASAAVIALAAGFSLISAPALSADVNFKGKKITFWTPHRGAESVLSQKTWGKYISKYLPGNPEITVKSKFGGGGVTNANFFEATAKPNGLTASMHNMSVFLNYALKRKGVKYDPRKWPVLGSEPANYVAIAGKAANVNSVDDFGKVKKTLSFGTRGRNFNVLMAELIWQAVGQPVKVTQGFGGDSTVRQALGSGELELGYTNHISFLRQKTTQEAIGIKGLYQIGFLQSDGSVKRADYLPQLPTALEVFTKYNAGNPDTQERRAMIDATKMWQIGKSYFLPKGTDGAIVDAWRTAMGKAIADPEFQKEHTRLVGLPLDHVRYNQTAKLLDGTYKTLGSPFFQKGGAGYAMAIGDRKKRKKK